MGVHDGLIMYIKQCSFNLWNCKGKPTLIMNDGEKFYNTELIVPRLSDVSDILPITISERLFLD